jgi:hypothetical protein
MSTKSDVYPITSNLAHDLYLNKERLTLQKSGTQLANDMVEYIGEYEHGTVDVSDLMDSYPLPEIELSADEDILDAQKVAIQKWKLEFMAAVLGDFFLFTAEKK